MTASRDSAGLPGALDGYEEIPPLGMPPAEGVIRVRPEDFVVRERLGMAPEGGGEHLWLRIQKRALTTEEVARLLARHAGVAYRDVGYAGLKDRHAVTEQWFSIHKSSATDEDWSSALPPALQVLERSRHRRKIKKGALRGNAFEITVRKVRGDPGQVQAVCERLRDTGFPNYFGEQRFGRQRGNVARARAMLGGQKAVRDRFSRGLYLSAARAEIFNRVLAVRVRAGSWDTALVGDALVLDGSRSYFVEEQITGEIAARVKRGDLHPSGPLWGAGGPPTRAGVLALENEVAAGQPELKVGLSGYGMQHARRPLRVIPKDLEARWLDAETLQLRFSLPAGSYATALLREIVRYESGCG